MNEIDDILAEVKAEYEAEKDTEKQVKNQEKYRKRANPLADSASTASLDSLLNEIQEEFKEPNASNQKNKRKSNYQHSKIKPHQIKTKNQNQNLISDLKQEFQIIQQQEIIEAQKQQQQKELRRQAALEKKARQWLNNLNLNSDEGLWFEEFSYAYETKLAAAIDYLQAMKESGM